MSDFGCGNTPKIYFTKAQTTISCSRIGRLPSAIARMPVPKFVCEVAYACGFASPMDDCVSWNTRSIA